MDTPRILLERRPAAQLTATLGLATLMLTTAPHPVGATPPDEAATDDTQSTVEAPDASEEGPAPKGDAAHERGAAAPSGVADEGGGGEEARGPRDYEEIAELEDLEEKMLRPQIVGVTEDWKPELLAPQQGTLSMLRRDTGAQSDSEDEEAGEVPSGSALLERPEVRALLEKTRVLGRVASTYPSVQAYLDFFDGRGKWTLSRWVGRMRRFEPMIREVLEEQGLPTDLIYVAMIESGFSPSVRSPAGAVGVWQFIRSTGRHMGLRIDRWVDERRDPIRATRAAARFLKKLHERFGSWPLALAAYNAGPARISRTMSRHNSNNYWFMLRHEHLYRRASRYVPKIIAAAIIDKNRKLFGLEPIGGDEAFDFERVEVPAGTRLSLVARAAGCSLDDLEELNPHLRRRQTPPGDGTYPVRIPSDSLERFVAGFDEFEKKEGLEHITHRVRFGETLAMIAKAHEVAPRVLRVANGLGRRERVSYGAEIIVPSAARGSWKGGSDAAPEMVVVPEPPVTLEGRRRLYYRVQRGDSLEAISRGLRVKRADLVVWNKLDPRANLKAGFVLQLYVDEDYDASRAVLLDPADEHVVVEGSEEHEALEASRRRAKRRSRRRARRRSRRSTGRSYEVRSGDSLWKIAKRHRVSVSAIQAANPQLRGSTLRPGQELSIPRKSADGKVHVVRSGDSLWKIAKKYDCTVEDLERENPSLRKDKTLQPGQQISLP